MIIYTEPKLAAKPVMFRYLHYIITSVRLKSFRSWKADGEPNPFVEKTYRPIQTERIEFVDIFEDILASPHGR